MPHQLGDRTWRLAVGALELSCGVGGCCYSWKFLLYFRLRGLEISRPAQFQILREMPHMSKVSFQNTSRLLCKLPNNCRRNHPQRGRVYLTSVPGGSDGKESACNAGDLGWEDSLEKEMATHSSWVILAWRIPWTEEPGGLQSMKTQGVGHD